MITLSINGQEVSATSHVNKGGDKIDKETHSQFAERLGTCISNGWALLARLIRWKAGLRKDLQPNSATKNTIGLWGNVYK